MILVKKTKGKNKRLIRLVIADNHFLVRKELISKLKNYSSVKIVGEFERFSDTIENITLLKPDVILLNASIPDMTVTEALLLILEKKSDIRVIALTMFDSQEIITEMLEYGAKGLILKDILPEELKNAIETVLRGEIYNGLKTSEINNKKHTVKKKNVRMNYHDNKLTEREIEVLICVINGLSNKDISDKLSLSLRTIETHRHNIKKKLNISSIEGLTCYAINEGLIK
ncbi:MAG: response regulator transcription factor [Ignavibacteria bacterium]|nr:response regulator transcription factor [Ignavibacteria bacterium]